MATKQILRQNSMNYDKSDFSPHLSCGEISPHNKFVSTFLHMTDLSPYIYHVETFLQLTICYVENFSLSPCLPSAVWSKFLHMADFSPQIRGMGGCLLESCDCYIEASSFHAKQKWKYELYFTVSLKIHFDA